jgi:hypothetical protein
MISNFFPRPLIRQEKMITFLQVSSGLQRQVNLYCTEFQYIFVFLRDGMELTLYCD